MNSKQAILLGAVLCGVGLGIGILIGYFGIAKSGGKEEEPKVSIPEYQKSCDARCSDEAEVADSCSPPLPRYYVTHHLNGKTINVDGKLDDEAWAEVPWTENFMDIRGPDYPAPPVVTKVKIRWDDEAIYFGAYMQENHVWATYDQKDTRLYKENAFEIFLDVDNSMIMYKEIEINALGTTWDLMLQRAYMDGGDWRDWEGIRDKGVYTDGVVNNATVPATFWSIEISFPYDALNFNTTRTALTPEDGEMWFMILARPRYDIRPASNGSYERVPGTGATWISWAPIGAINLHLPSKWGLLFFENDAPSSTIPVVDSKRWVTYQALFETFNALKSFRVTMGTYVDNTNELDLPLFVSSGECLRSIAIKLYSEDMDGYEGFEVTIESKSEPGVKGHIDQNRHVYFT